MIACLVALAAAALISLHPWEPKSVTPSLNVAPEPGVALGDAVAVSPGERPAVAPARSAAGGPARFADLASTGSEGDSRPEPAIAPARPVTRVLPRPPQGASQPPMPETAPGPPAPTPVAMPVAATAPPASGPMPAAPPDGAVRGGGSLPGPIGAGAGPGEGSGSPIEVADGGEYALAFAFLVQSTVYRAPGDENLIMRFEGDAEAPTFGLQVWDDGSGRRGLWSSGGAMGGERFLTPLEEGVWHEAVLSFKASSEDDGFYVLLLDGRPIDVRAGVSLVDPGGDSARIEVGLFRDGETVVGSPDVLFGSAQLGESLESVLP